MAGYLGEEMIRRLQNPPLPEKRPWKNVRERRDVRCPDCGKVYQNTKREFCGRCDGYLREVTTNGS